MKQLKIVFIVLSVLILAGVIAYLGWIFYLRFQRQTESPLKAISENTAILIKLNRPTALWEETYEGNLLWKELCAIPYLGSLNEDLNRIDSLLKKNPQIYRIVQKGPCYAAMTLTGRSTYGFLFLVSVPGIDDESEIVSMLEETYGKKMSVIKTQYGSANLVRVTFSGQKDPVYLAVRSGIFMGSLHPELIRKAIDQLSLNIPSIISTGFTKAETTTGKKVDANIFINYKLIHPFTARLLQNDQVSEVDRIQGFADWSGLDVILKKNELLVNGYTTICDTGTQYLRIFTKQAPQKIAVTGILPDNTSRFMWIGFSEIEKYYRGFLAYAQRNEDYLEKYGTVVKFEEENQVDVRDYFLPWIGNEICLTRSLNDRDTPHEDIYAVFRVKNAMLADSLLQAISSMTGKKKDSIRYKNHRILFQPLQDLIPSIFGRPFRELNSSCYTHIGDYIVFGNNTLALKYFIDHVEYSKVLGNDKTYQSLSENLSDNANLYYYFNTDRTITRIKSVFSDELNEQLEPAIDTLKKFEALTLQFTNRDGIFYTNLFVHYNPVSEVPEPLLWQAKLDTLLLGKPQFVPSGKKTNLLLAFDVDNSLYQIDSTGHVNWTVHLPGKPMGPVWVLQQRAKEGTTYLFNTEGMICLVNESGTFVDGYPCPLPAKATASLTLFEAVGKGNKQLLIPLSDNKVHLLELNGTAVRGWMTPFIPEGISQPVQVVQSGKKMFFIIHGKNGHLVITDSRGKSLAKQPKSFIVSQSNRVYLTKPGRKGFLLTTDPSGKILYLKEDWKTSEATLNLFSPDHLFFYEDINGDGKFEYIFFDKGRLFFYNKSNRLVFTYAFRREITVPPFLIRLPDGKTRIGAVSAPANELYLFGKEGLVGIEPGIRGNTGFAVGSFGSEEYWNLLVGSGRTLKNYRLPKK